MAISHLPLASNEIETATGRWRFFLLHDANCRIWLNKTIILILSFIIIFLPNKILFSFFRGIYHTFADILLYINAMNVW
jgi:hypothetical protein